MSAPRLSTDGVRDRDTALSVRESEVIFFLMQFGTTEKVYRYLHIKADTLDRHIQHIYAKTGRGSFIELAQWARWQDII